MGLVGYILVGLYMVTLLGVSLYGIHRYKLMYLYRRYRGNTHKAPGTFSPLPRVTVQLPMYNEDAVARRCIEAVCHLDWPRELLQIQVLDDSTGSEADTARLATEEFRQKGFPIEYLHRENRQGYKAGALAEGLKTATGEFVAIFDADFVPGPSFIKDVIHHFTDPKVCVVQTRWDHINRNDSMLTRSQALFLDGHFAIEHIARNRSDRFMSFNGTAGTWRVSAIEDAGGWSHDTLTEDLDLSYRAQLKGWKFVFLPDLTAPAELPPEMNAFKAQQFRWTKGGAQVALKLLPKVLLSKAPLKVKVEAFFHLTCFTMHLYMLLLVLMLFPAMYIQCVPMSSGSLWRGLFDIGVFALATMSACVFYMASQIELAGDWRTALKYMPMLMALGVGTSVSNAKAVVEALLGKKSEFVRTPKYGVDKGGLAGSVMEMNSKKARKRKSMPYVEFAFGLYMTACAACSLMDVKYALSSPFLVIFAFGFFYVSVMSFLAARSVRNTAKAAQVAMEKASL